VGESVETVLRGALLALCVDKRWHPVSETVERYRLEEIENSMHPQN
jgi:hypothetical protein